MNAEVVIIGGGPAGISAGIHLAQKGIKVSIIEIRKYPREKTCAGILTEKTRCFLRDSLSYDVNGLFASNNQVSVYFEKKYMYSFLTGHAFSFVDRNIFDYELLKRFKDAGGILLEQEKVVNINPVERRLQLSNGQDLSYQALIAADGVNSLTRKQLNLADIPKAFCIQDSVSCSSHPEFTKKISGLYLEYGSIPYGYSWVVPNQNEIIFGTGMMIKDFNWNYMREQHEKFCMLFNLPQDSVRRGAFVPVGELTNQQSHPYENIVFIGDAAGLINPITGEGIYLSLLSGKLAAEAYLTSPGDFRSTFFTLMKPSLDTISEQKNLLPEIYEKSFLKQFICQFKDYPEYMSSVSDDVISSETRSYVSLLREVKALLR